MLTSRRIRLAFALPDGSRAESVFSTGDRIQELFNFVNNLRAPCLQGKEFDLMRTNPDDDQLVLGMWGERTSRLEHAVSDQCPMHPVISS